MRTEAEHIAEGIREYVAKLNELLELARAEHLTVVLLNGAGYGCQSLHVDSIYRTEIL